MKGLSKYIIETLEDGKYIDYPEKKWKPKSGMHIPREVAQKAKEEWKEYVKNVQRINGENLEILISNLKKAISNSKGTKSFIMNADECKFDNFYGGTDENGRKDFFDAVEYAVKGARVALELKDLDLDSFKSTRPFAGGGQRHLFFIDSPFTASIYSYIGKIAAAYNVDIPEFNKEFDKMSAMSYDTRREEWYDEHRRPGKDVNMSDKVRDKIKADYEKDVINVKKAREAFRKTQLYKDIVAILDIVEKDLKANDNNYIPWIAEMEAKAKRDEETKKLNDAMNAVAEYVKNAIENEYSSVPYGAANLHKMVASVYVETGEMPEIKVKDSKTGSWLAGMHHKVTWEVVGRDGTSYGTIQTEDNGIDGPTGPVDGFGPWD